MPNTIVTSRPSLYFTNSLSRKKEAFTPIDETNVRLYVCGITPYAPSHIGHSRVYVVYDVLFRLLRQVYGEAHVTYVRNYTDIDDKLIAAAKEHNQTPMQVAERFIAEDQATIAALNALPPTHSPRVSDTMPQIMVFIQTLLKKEVAYITPEGDVNFDVAKKADYGKLSGNKLEDLEAGTRVAVSEHKRNPQDFVLWKASKPNEPAWALTHHGQTLSGRPGWHIECSAMAKELLGEQFDLHGGGEDLQFPHHECEIAQSEAAHGCPMANVWVHNAFVTMNNEKMSKSIGNVKNIKDLLALFPTPELGGLAMRAWLLGTHYRKPINFSEEGLKAAFKRAKRWFVAAQAQNDAPVDDEVFQQAVAALADDLNTAKVLAILDGLRSQPEQVNTLKAVADLVGLRL